MRTWTAAVVVATGALVAGSSAQAETISFTGSGGAVPDGNAAGASFDISVPDTRVIGATGNNVTLTLIDVSTPATGWMDPFGGLVEFAATLEHVGAGAPEFVFANVLNGGDYVCFAGLHGTYTFRSGEPTTLRSQCGNTGIGTQPALIAPGTYLTTAADDTTDSGLSAAWNGHSAAGTWRLHIGDTNIITNPDQFVLNSTWTWRLDFELQPADLSLQASDSADPVTVGDAFAYTLTVTNNGPNRAAGPATVTDTLPASVSYDDAASDPQCNPGPARTVTCAVGALAAGASKTLRIAVRATAAGTATNTATVTGAEPDTAPADNTATEQTTIKTPVAATIPPPTIPTPAPAALVARCNGRQPAIVAEAGRITRGTPGRDVILGSTGRDRIRSGGGNDLICTRGGNDMINSGSGRDQIATGGGRDRVDAGAGNDRIDPGSGRDRITAGPGNDRLALAGNARDDADCGAGKRDRSRADRTDRLRNCEIVRRVRGGR
jgi:uncharacterized repeat protein (TIGR01451 family)